ncbi:potassium channel family protein [Sedimentitalea todarodis]|uniref:Potassium channel family protein n=1 Tax=Sedimentitalea todarodis TaxID=1631240 RepID=A0ABU3VAX8_9RHOB|nr:potassium channel family protein [Sedimentitalea todarodis]MDU9003309.1 potassium channel family protein [Sedimentitalea todarodis]
MTVVQQVLWGSAVLGLCLIIHVSCLAVCARVLESISQRVRHRKLAMQIAIMLMLALGILIVALTIEVWIWSTIWILFGIFSDWNESVYFSLVTFTALGYGDLVVGPEARIFATFAAVTGLLSFGLSTAFLVAVTNRLLVADREDHHSRTLRRH